MFLFLVLLLFYLFPFMLHFPLHSRSFSFGSFLAFHSLTLMADNSKLSLNIFRKAWQIAAAQRRHMGMPASNISWDVLTL